MPFKAENLRPFGSIKQGGSAQFHYDATNTGANGVAEKSTGTGSVASPGYFKNAGMLNSDGQVSTVNVATTDATGDNILIVRGKGPGKDCTVRVVTATAGPTS